jgi:hypothetical protein
MHQTNAADEKCNVRGEPSGAILPSQKSPSNPEEREAAERSNRRAAENRERFIYSPWRRFVRRPVRRIVICLDQHSSLVTAVATACIAALTIFLAWYAHDQDTLFKKQLKVMQGQLNDMQQSSAVALKVQQPYIFVPPPKYVVSVVPPATIEAPNIQYRMVNEGLTPAIVRFRKDVAYIQRQPKSDNKFVDEPMDEQPTLESFIVEKGFDATRTLILLRQNRLRSAGDPKINMTATLMFWTEIQYFDIFDYVHTSRFLFFGEIKQDASIGDFYAISGEPYSHHDAVKAPLGKWMPDLGTKPPYGR